MTEELSYRVLATYPDFEIRRYPAHHLVRTTASGDLISAGNRAFSPLLGYISGANTDRTRISMTAPVLQHESQPGIHDVAFVLPDAVHRSHVPTPTNPGLETVLVPERDAAVVRFSGSWREDRMRRYAQQLRDALNREGISTVGEVTFARFDPPWKPGFLKRTEAIIDLAAPYSE